MKPIWEYKIVKNGIYYTEAQLNELGREGWELVTSVKTPTIRGALWFKRQVTG